MEASERFFAFKIANAEEKRFAWVFSHTEDRFCRKNRRPPTGEGSCHGVDINRNFHVGYGLGASTDSCSEIYQGPAAGSEPETQALMAVGQRLNSSLLYYVSLHAYGQSWLTPWGYKTDQHPRRSNKD